MTTTVGNETASSLRGGWREVEQSDPCWLHFSAAGQVLERFKKKEKAQELRVRSISGCISAMTSDKQSGESFKSVIDIHGDELTRIQSVGPSP